jgi:hypothetical protein
VTSVFAVCRVNVRRIVLSPTVSPTPRRTCPDRPFIVGWTDHADPPVLIDQVAGIAPMVSVLKRSSTSVVPVVSAGTGSRSVLRRVTAS